jgi:hypothetical protein
METSFTRNEMNAGQARERTRIMVSFRSNIDVFGGWTRGAAIAFRLSLEEPIGANCGHLGQDRLFFAAILDPGVKSLERRSLNQGVMTVGCFNGNNVQEGSAIAEPE